MATTPDYPTVALAAAGLDDDLIRLRREIHRWPELADAEQRTAGLVTEQLRAAGLPVTTGVGVRPPQTPEEHRLLGTYLQQPDGVLARFCFTVGVTEAHGENVTVRAWLRAWPDDRYPALRKEIDRLASEAGGGKVTSPVPRFPAMICNPELSLAAATYLRDVAGVPVRTLRAAFPFNGEDFALFLQRVPGAMFYLGVSNPEDGLVGAPHMREFAADERAIGTGVRAMAGFLLSRLSAIGGTGVTPRSLPTGRP